VRGRGEVGGGRGLCWCRGRTVTVGGYYDSVGSQGAGGVFGERTSEDSEYSGQSPISPGDSRQHTPTKPKNAPEKVVRAFSPLSFFFFFFFLFRLSLFWPVSREQAPPWSQAGFSSAGGAAFSSLFLSLELRHSLLTEAETLTPDLLAALVYPPPLFAWA